MLLTRASKFMAGVAFAVVAVLTVSGCKVSLNAAPAASAKASAKPTAHHAKETSAKHRSAKSKTSPHAKSGHSHAQPHQQQSADALIVEPSGSFSPVYRLISNARHSINITMYEFTDSTAEGDLAAAAKRGVHVQVILDQRESSTNKTAYKYFNAHGIKVVWSSTAFQYTHQKTLTADGSEAIIMTANLTSQYYSTSRDFLVTDTSKSDVAAITAVFNADFAHRSITPGDGADLVWSPTDSQGKLLGVINGATKSLRIYSEEMGDTVVENALIAAAKRGVDVQVCGENEDGEYNSAYGKLAKAGVHISYYDSPSGFYIHGKVIEADFGTSRAKVFIGSENFSSTSLNRNRELGLITSTPAILSAIATTFAGDFQRGTHQS
jgi:cardiolipin synthase A/B